MDVNFNIVIMMLLLGVVLVVIYLIEWLYFYFVFLLMIFDEMIFWKKNINYNYIWKNEEEMVIL